LSPELRISAVHPDQDAVSIYSLCSQGKEGKPGEPGAPGSAGMKVRISIFVYLINFVTKSSQREYSTTT